MMAFIKRVNYSMPDKLAWVVLLIFCAWLALPWIGKLEGQYFPVVRDFQVIKWQSGERKFNSHTPIDATRIGGTMEIVRASCDFLRVEAELRSDIKRTELKLVFEEASKLRLEGVHDWGEWALAAPIDSVQDHGVLISYHQCPWRPWLTETHLFP